MRHSGFSLVELALILALLAALFLTAAPVLRHARAVLATRAAAAEVMAAVAATRAQGVLTGGAQLVITPGGEVRVERSDGMPLRDPVQLGARYGVTIQTAGDAPVVLRYDALGIGRLASTTVRLSRNGAAVRVIVSAYGRART